MLLIVGLGNPGAKYHNTRHNIGFMLADRLAVKHGIRFAQAEKAFWGKGVISGKEALIIKPQTFMNLSGEAVKRFADAYCVPPESIIIAYDDLDLPPGRLRLRKNGGGGGHRGMASVISLLGTQDFPRVRLGIGRPVVGDIVDYVLSPFDADELVAVEELLGRAVESVEAVACEGIEAAMNRFNSN